MWESLHGLGQHKSRAEEERVGIAGATSSSYRVSTCRVLDATWTVYKFYLLSDSDSPDEETDLSEGGYSSKFTQPTRGRAR